MRKSSQSLGPLEQFLLDYVTKEYLESREFNGVSTLFIDKVLNLPKMDFKGIISELITKEKLELNFGQNFPNVHIRAWNLGSITTQLEYLESWDGDSLILYPSRKHLKKVASRRFRGRPFTLRLALGEGQMEPLFFEISVLEMYRNDPRYYYKCSSSNGYISVREEHSTGMRSTDKILLQTFGFAFNENLDRYVAVYLYYLSRLSSEHQQIWNARLVPLKLRLHPDYYKASILGEFPDHIGVFEAFILEQKTINDLTALIGKPPLFRKILAEMDVPDFTFLIRPTLKEFNAFVHLLDKVLSDNLNKRFFEGDIELKREREQDGKVVIVEKGTLVLLQEWLAKHHSKISGGQIVIDEIIEPLKKIRNLRMKPAHVLEEDVFDQSYLKKQRDLVVASYIAMQRLREIFNSYPNACNYEIDEMLKYGRIRTF